MRAARAFAADVRPAKINLGIGMYYDDHGRIPVLQAVRKAEKRIRERNRSWSYLLTEGLPSFLEGALKSAVGDEVASAIDDRTSSIQTLGGTGAIRLGAELLKAFAPDVTVAISSPSWPNHEAIMKAVGLKISRYVYHDVTASGLDYKGMMRDIEALAEGSAVVLHACCHNPTGWDPTPEQWKEIAATLARRKLVPFLDMAYQGFGMGFEVDSAPVREIAATCAPVLLAVSFSKSFSLYGERVGALCVVTENAKQASMLGERARVITRALHSSPPSHGALLVSEVLKDGELRQEWLGELDAMRLRIAAMRESLMENLRSGNSPRDFSFLARQRGLFSYSGLTRSEISTLRDEHAIHAVEDGRLCLAALNGSNIGRVASAIRQVSMLV